MTSSTNAGPSASSVPPQVATLKQWMAGNEAALKEAGVATIEGTYCGSGDEGQFVGVDVFDAEVRHIAFDVPEEITDAIEALADRLAPSGYENNDGGGGTIRLNTAERTVTHNSYSTVMTEEYDEPEVF